MSTGTCASTLTLGSSCVPTCPGNTNHRSTASMCTENGVFIPGECMNEIDFFANAFVMDYKMSMSIDTSSLDLTNESILETLIRAIRRSLAIILGVSEEQILSLELNLGDDNDRRRLVSELNPQRGRYLSSKSKQVVLTFDVQYNDEESMSNGK